MMERFDSNWYSIGIFDGQDVLGPGLVDDLDQSGQSSGLALPDRSDRQEESLPAAGEGLQDRRQIELGQGTDDPRDEA